MENENQDTQAHLSAGSLYARFESPYMHAPETAKAIFLITLAAAGAPFIGGMVFFGWRAVLVLLLSVSTCVIVEKIFYRVVRTPALIGRSHAYLTGVLLTLTLPALVPWYVPVIAAIFATIIGKAVFGGVGHFVWQPALVGRLAVAVIFPALLSPAHWPLLAQENIVTGDIARTQRSENYTQWKNTAPPKRMSNSPASADGFLLPHPNRTLRNIYKKNAPVYGCIAFATNPHPRAGGLLVSKMPPVSELFLGARGGSIGETSVLLILIAGIYLIYRNYTKWLLPATFIASALIVAAIAPIYLTGDNGITRTVWLPFCAEGKAWAVTLFSQRVVFATDVGLVFLIYHLLSSQLMLSAFFMATEMTCRPITARGQFVFAAGAGALAMTLTVSTSVPIPAFLAILAMNTLTPAIDSLCKPKVFSKTKQ